MIVTNVVLNTEGECSKRENEMLLDEVKSIREL